MGHMPSTMFSHVLIDEYYHMKSFSWTGSHAKHCDSCGEAEDHMELDHHGWCEKTAAVFWEKVKRLHGHRMVKERAVV